MIVQRQTDTEFAGAGAIGHLMAIVIVGGVGAVILYVVQKSQFAFTGLSQDAANTIWFLEQGLVYSFMLILIAIIISHWINEKSEANQGA